jgi:hypothetical protein
MPEKSSFSWFYDCRAMVGGVASLPRREQWRGSVAAPPVMARQY